MKKKISACFLLCAVGAGLASGAEPADVFGEIAFVGDSITQGAGENYSLKDTSRSYRYHLWKIFLTNGVAWNPVGSQTVFRDGSSASDSQTPSFLGYEYDNRSEGHYGWTGAGILSGQNSAQANSGAGTLSEWLADTECYPSGSADTVTILLGINDLSATGSTYESVAANLQSIIAAYQEANPNVTVHVFSVLPRTGSTNASGTTQTWAERVSGYNAYLEENVGAWSTSTSTVLFHDITTGIDPTGFPDGLHPGNGAGALMVAKNIAKALGLNPVIDYGREQVAAENLASQATFSQGSDGAWAASVQSAGTTRTMTYFTDTSGAGASWSVGDDGVLSVRATDGGSGIKLENWGADASSGAHEFTLEISVKMIAADAAKNYLGVWCGIGDGSTVGMLYIGEHGIFWGTTSSLLYGYISDDYANGFSMTEDFRNIRVAYMFNEGSETEGRFYVWLDGELIGDSLLGSDNTAWGNHLLVGDIGTAYEVSADIASIAFDAGTALQPILAIPEPGAFGLLAGTLALAFAASRRRRRA